MRRILIKSKEELMKILPYHGLTIESRVIDSETGLIGEKVKLMENGETVLLLNVYDFYPLDSRNNPHPKKRKDCKICRKWSI